MIVCRAETDGQSGEAAVIHDLQLYTDILRGLFYTSSSTETFYVAYSIPAVLAIYYTHGILRQQLRQEPVALFCFVLFAEKSAEEFYAVLLRT